MAVRSHEIPHRPAEDFGQRQAGDLADDIPQREVNARDGRGADDAVSVPEVLSIHYLPKMLGPRGVLSHEQFREVFDRADDTARVPLERRFAPADESRLIGDNFYEHPVPHPGVADERVDSLNFHPQKSTSPAAPLEGCSRFISPLTR